jgi:type I restriction enzyme S subunit
MAQAIYKEWFINFRFPGYEKIRMVKSELGMIPEGWEVTKIGELLRKIERKPRVKKEDYLEQGDVPAIGQGAEFIGGYTNDYDALHDNPLPIIVFGDHTRIIKYLDFPFASGADGTQLLYPENEELMPAYFYYAAKNIDLSNFAYARHFKFLKEQEVLIPDSQTLKTFNHNVELFLKQSSIFQKKNDNLCKTRDLLLPKLISGEIDVEKMDIRISEEVN